MGLHAGGFHLPLAGPWTLTVTVGHQTGSVTSPGHPREQKSRGLSSLTSLLRLIRDVLGEWELDLGMGGWGRRVQSSRKGLNTQ